MHLIGSQTPLLPPLLILLALLQSFGQTNLSIAASILSTKNIVPFFKASLISGVSIIAGLIISLRYFNMGIATLLLVPFMVDLSYQAWKWPLDIARDLKLKARDYLKFIEKI